MNAPLLLTAGAPSLEDQVQEARTRHDCMGFWCWDRFFFCWIQSSGIRSSVPDWVRARETWGCIAVDTAPIRAIEDDTTSNHTSHVLFHPAWYREAWGIARLIAGSNHFRPAVLIERNLAHGVFIFVAPKHRVIMRGEAVQ